MEMLGYMKQAIKEKWSSNLIKTKFENLQEICRESPDFFRFRKHPNETVIEALDENSGVYARLSITADTIEIKCKNEDIFKKSIRELGKIKWNDTINIIDGISPGISNILERNGGKIEEIIKWFQYWGYKNDIKEIELKNDKEIKDYIINECIKHWEEIKDIYQNSDEEGKISISRNIFHEFINRLEKGIWKREELDKRYEGLFYFLNKTYCNNKYRNKVSSPQIMIWNDYLIIPDKIKTEEDKKKLTKILDIMYDEENVFSQFKNEWKIEWKQQMFCKKDFYENIEKNYEDLRKIEIDKNDQEAKLWISPFLSLIFISLISWMVGYLYWKDIIYSLQLTGILLILFAIFQHLSCSVFRKNFGENWDILTSTFMIIWHIIYTYFILIKIIDFKTGLTILFIIYLGIFFGIILFKKIRKITQITYLRGIPYRSTQLIIPEILLTFISRTHNFKTNSNIELIVISIIIVWFIASIIYLYLFNFLNEKKKKSLECMQSIFKIWLNEGDFIDIYANSKDFKNYKTTLKKMRSDCKVKLEGKPN